MSDWEIAKKRVLERWPEGRWDIFSPDPEVDIHIIMPDRREHDGCNEIGRGIDEPAAWLDADSRLSPAPVEDDPAEGFEEAWAEADMIESLESGEEYIVVKYWSRHYWIASAERARK